MRSLISVMRQNKLKAMLWFALVTVLAAGGFMASARATDQSSFCSSCHEMTPFYSAWAEGRGHLDLRRP